MTKRELKQVISMFHNGVASGLCIAVIIDKTRDKHPSITADFIWQFLDATHLVVVKQNKSNNKT